VLIVECWDGCYPFQIMPRSQLQDRLLALYGPAGKGRLKPEDVATISFGELNAWLAKPADPANASVAKLMGDAAWVLFALTEYNPDSYPDSAAVKRFLDAPPVDLRNKNLIGVAYNAPYHLDSTEISKLAAYFAVYSKTDTAIDTSFRALFGDVTPRGHSPVNVSGTFYSVSDAVQPDPSQSLNVSIYGQQADAVRDTRTIGLVAGPIVDHNTNPVPDGTSVRFTLAKEDGGTTTANAVTIDGIAAAQLASSGRGRYTVSATVGSLVSQPLRLHRLTSRRRPLHLVAALASRWYWLLASESRRP
jgi:beta-N-acetylhexosaminidase